MTPDDIYKIIRPVMWHCSCDQDADAAAKAIHPLMNAFAMVRVTDEEMDHLRNNEEARKIRGYPNFYTLNNETGDMRVWPVPSPEVQFLFSA